jgi:hypothetical protein
MLTTAKASAENESSSFKPSTYTEIANYLNENFEQAGAIKTAANCKTRWGRVSRIPSLKHK